MGDEEQKSRVNPYGTEIRIEQRAAEEIVVNEAR